MTNAFPLAGLLRLRKLQEDKSAAALAAARGRAEDTRRRNRRLREVLGADSTTASSVGHVVAIAAARASSSSMLSELEALGRSAGDEEARALAEHQEARRRALALEKLEEKHDATVQAERGVEEQRVLDELAVRGWSTAQKNTAQKNTDQGNADQTNADQRNADQRNTEQNGSPR